MHDLSTLLNPHHCHKLVHSTERQYMTLQIFPLCTIRGSLCRTPNALAKSQQKLPELTLIKKEQYIKKSLSESAFCVVIALIP